MSGAIRWNSDKQLKLSKIDPSYHDGLMEDEAKLRFAQYSAELGELQELMYAANMNSVLIVFQAMDTGGKDGCIRNVMNVVNPQGCTVSAFKVPSALEQSHDFLWRVHASAPPKGHFAIFNRSHYEDVLVTRVHNLVPKPVWKARYKQIEHFEDMLAESDTIILKFFLYISRDEQEHRLMKREDDPSKAWKLSAGDWKEREFWDDYMSAYEDAVTKTSSDNAPWFVIPANHKWYRDLIVTQAIVEALRPYRKTWRKKLVALGEKMKAELAQVRQADTASDTTPADKDRHKG